MSELFKLTILTPERRLADRIEVASVTLPGSEGQIEVLPGHAAMMGTLETGTFRYVNARASEPVVGVISSGFFEVRDDELVVLAETLELKGEVDLGRAKAAQKKAEEKLLDADIDEQSWKKYQLKLQRAIIRQQFASNEHSGLEN